MAIATWPGRRGRKPAAFLRPAAEEIESGYPGALREWGAAGLGRFLVTFVAHFYGKAHCFNRIKLCQADHGRIDAADQLVFTGA